MQQHLPSEWNAFSPLAMWDQLHSMSQSWSMYRHCICIRICKAASINAHITTCLMLCDSGTSAIWEIGQCAHDFHFLTIVLTSLLTEGEELY